MLKLKWRRGFTNETASIEPCGKRYKGAKFKWLLVKRNKAIESIATEKPFFSDVADFSVLHASCLH